VGQSGHKKPMRKKKIRSPFKKRQICQAATARVRLVPLVGCGGKGLKPGVPNKTGGLLSGRMKGRWKKERDRNWKTTQTVESGIMWAVVQVGLA